MPGAGHDVAGRQRHLVVDVAVLEVELALAEVLVGVPAVHVVVDRHARVPLGELVQRPLATHPVGAVLGDVEAVGQVEHGRARRGRAAAPAPRTSWCRPPGRSSGDRRLGAARRPGPAGAAAAAWPPRAGGDALGEARDLEAAGEPGRRRTGSRDANSSDPDAARPEQVLVHLHPDEPQGVRGVVGVADLLGRGRAAWRRCRAWP